MAGPPGGFFSPACLSHPQQLLQVIGQVAVLLAFFQQLQILPHQSRSTPQQKGDLTGLTATLGKLRYAHEGRKVIGDGFR
jgi:hypothetical protein